MGKIDISVLFLISESWVWYDGTELRDHPIWLDCQKGLF